MSIEESRAQGYATGHHARPHRKVRRLLLGGVAFVATLVQGAASAQICTPYLASLPKDSRLFLYFPTADDATFPTNTLGHITGVNSQPLTAFTPANLDSDLAATAVALRNRITEQVRDSYCEFSVEVIQSTAEPNPTGTDWQVVGIGGDSDPGGRFGRAQDVDTGDVDREDYARVWGRGFHDSYGGAGEAVAPANATLERWATAIAGTAAHEAGHNFGLPHEFSAPRPGEDMQNNHLLATGSTGLTGEQRVTRRHFSDRSFETLGYNLGLNTKTLSNWDFVNPNDSAATGLRIRLLSTAGSLSLTGVYGGTSSPWTGPSLTKQAGTQSFRGTSYNIYDLVFSTGKSWSGGASGVVPAGADFHVGAGVNAEIVVYDVVLTDAGGDMDLHPRMVGYDFGLGDSDDATAGFGVIRFFANERDAGDLVLANVQVRFLPRPVSLEQMVGGGGLISDEGVPVQPFSRLPSQRGDRRVTDRLERGEVGETYTLPIAHLTDRRHLDVTIQPTALCDENNRTIATLDAGPSDRPGPGEEDYCAAGDYISLFPATFVYVIATVIEPNARRFDPVAGTFVDGPLETTLYAQFAGVIPDFDGSGVDDYLEIRDGTVPDENGNGIPDGAEGTGPGGAAGRWSVHGSLGVTLPEPSGLDGDLSASLGVDRHLTADRSIGVRLGHHGFESSASSDDLEAVELSLRAELSHFVTPAFRLFVGGGIGAYFFDPGDTEAGAHGGAGAGRLLTSRIDIEVRADYHEIIDGDTDFATVQAGIRVRF
jgi:hypothetical protein